MNSSHPSKKVILFKKIQILTCKSQKYFLNLNFNYFLFTLSPDLRYIFREFTLYVLGFVLTLPLDKCLVSKLVDPVQFNRGAAVRSCYARLVFIAQCTESSALAVLFLLRTLYYQDNALTYFGHNFSRIPFLTALTNLKTFN